MKFIKGRFLSIEKENDKHVVKIKEKLSENVLTFNTKDTKLGSNLELVVDDKTSQIVIAQDVSHLILPMNIFIVYFILFIKSILSTISYSITFCVIIILLSIDKTEIVDLVSFCMSIIEFILLSCAVIDEVKEIRILIILCPVLIFSIHLLFNIRKIIKGKKKGSLFIGNVKNLSIIRKIDTVWSYFM